ncbi:sodium-coupled monocarboxylate transporter 2-like [Amphiura filiformis]|uniref:sodium-coupled monocarboxylate transporter 2-like n=1 Tax=Amphiura filiformis TaxID=82378 RepID=UPI003B221293
MTSPWTPEPPTGLEDWWYGMSYLWYSGVAVASVIVFGLTVSFITGAQKPSELEPGLISPIFDIVMCCLPAKWRRFLWCGVRHDENKFHEKEGSQAEFVTVVKDQPNGYLPKIETSDVGVGIDEEDKEYFRVNRKKKVDTTIEEENEDNGDASTKL